MDHHQLLLQAKQALLALDSGQNIHDADVWLTNFQKTFQAWDISQILLDESDPFRFYGAKFLYSKLQKQFVSLDDTYADSLSRKLVQKIISVSQENPPPLAFCRFLCLALTALALQLNQPGVVRQILMWLNPVLTNSPHILLLLLTMLPEEAINPQYDVSHESKEAFFEQLDHSSHEVINFLPSVWTQVPVSNRSKVLKCAENWIDIVKTPHSVFFSSGVFNAMVDSLHHPQSDEFDNAVDLLVAVVRRYYIKEPGFVVDNVLPIVLSMRSQWQNLLAAIHHAGDFTEDLKSSAFSLCRLFAETAEATIDLYSNLQYNYGQKEMVDQLLQCASFSYDHSVARIPLKFFYELSMLLKAEYTHESLGDSGGGGSSSPTFEQLLVIYTPTYCQLLEITARNIVISSEVMISSTPLSDEIKDMRADWKEAVVDCCDVLTGIVCLNTLCAMMEQQIKEMSNGAGLNSVAHWCRIEAILETIQIVAPSIHHADASAVPQLISFLSTLPKELHHLQVTSIVLLGRLSNWLESNAMYINPALIKLGNDLGSPLLATWAASAIMQILRSCAKVPGLPLHEIRDHMKALKAHRSLSLEAEMHLLEGLTISCSQLPGASAEAFFRDLVLSTAQGLHEHLQDTGHTNSTVVISYIDRLAVVLRFFRGNQAALCGVFGELFSLLQQTLHIYGNVEAVCERVCRLYKHTIRSGAEHFAAILPAMADHLATQFRQTPVAAFLYASSVCFSTFALMNKGTFVPVLYQLLWSLSETFFSTCNDLASFERKPDLVEEYFFLVAKALQYCPASFLESSPNAVAIIQAALQGIAIQHREAQKGVLLFLEKLIGLITFWSPGSPHHNVAVQLVNQFGGHIVLELMRYLAGSAPLFSLDESNGSVVDVMLLLRKRCESQFQMWLTSAIQTLPPIPQTIAGKFNFVEVILTARSPRDVGTMVERFAVNCRRNT
jgi:hypothetical protein